MGGDISKTAWQSTKRLLHPRGRSESGRLLVEGARAVRTALERGSRPELVLLGPQATPLATQVAERASSKGCKVAHLSQEQAAELSATAHPQGIFSVVSWRAAHELPEQLPDLLLHLSGVRNPSNMGALLRSAAGFGVSVTCTADCVDVTHPSTVRSGAASFFGLSIYTGISATTLAQKAPDHQMIYAVSSDGLPLSQMKWPQKSILILGGEAEGATEPLAADTTVTIDSAVESFNVAVAGGILLWEAIRARPDHTGRKHA